MVNAQEWLDRNYPKELRAGIKNLDISRNPKASEEEKLADSLKLEGFINLEEFRCSFNQLVNLDLNDCINLENLDCSFNNLDSLDLSKCKKLTEVDCYNNLLTSIRLPSDSERLRLINLANNNFPEQKLSIFSHFINLKKISLGNWSKNKIERGVYNRFTGSLEFLKNLAKLRSLDIENTDINEGLEYLPDSIEVFHCKSSERRESKVKIFEEKLKPFVLKKRGRYDWQALKKPYKAFLDQVNKLKIINNDMQKFFDRRNEILTKLKELKNSESWINKIWYAKLLSQGIASIGGALSLKGYSELGGWLSLGGASAGFFFTEKERKLEKNSWEMKEDLKRKEKNWDNFLKEIEKIHADYQKLSEIWAKLNLTVNEDPTSSREINQAFDRFLKTIEEFKKEVNAYNVNEANAEQGTNEEWATNFIQSFQINWEKHNLQGTIDVLVTEVNGYRQQAYQLNRTKEDKSLLIFSSDNNQQIQPSEEPNKISKITEDQSHQSESTEIEATQSNWTTTFTPPSPLH